MSRNQNVVLIQVSETTTIYIYIYIYISGDDPVIRAEERDGDVQPDHAARAQGELSRLRLGGLLQAGTLYYEYAWYIITE